MYGNFKWFSAALLMVLLAGCSEVKLASEEATTSQSATVVAERAAVTVKLAPVYAATSDAAEVIRALQVNLELSGREFAAGEVVWQLPEIITNVETAAKGLGDLTASDAQGEFRLIASMDEQGLKQWRAERASKGAIRIQYQASIPAKAGALGVAPPIEPRVTGAAISAGTGIVVLEPALNEPLDYRVQWQLPDHAKGVSTLGVGNTDFQEFSQPSAFSATYLMAGDIGHYSSAGGEFVAAWQGQPPYDAQQLMQWGEQLYSYYNQYFAVDQAAQYTVFMRSNDINPGGGMARGSSFILTYDAKTDAEKLKGTLSHEMFHTFLGGLSEPSGLAASWFSEGLAVYYQWLIPLQAGMASTEQYLQSFNSTAVRYYTNSKKDTPNAEVPAGFWLDTRIRVLPYDRGSLYFAALNYRLQQASDGAVNLNQLLVYLREQEQNGAELTEQLWLAALEKFAGAAEVERFQQVQNGALVELADDVLGPEFERYEAPFRRYQLGFAPEVLTEQPRRIRGLIAGSNAAQAGLQNGDIILESVPQDSVQGNQQATLTLQIQRGDEQFAVTYLPRGEQVLAPQWRVKE